MHDDTWAEWGHWVAARGLAVRTRNLYRDRARACDRWLHRTRDRCVRLATRDELAAWHDTLPITPESRNLGRKALLRLGEWLIDSGRRTHWHADELPRMRERRGLPRPLPHPERLLDAARRLGPQPHVFAASMLLAGLRFTESRTLEWGSWEGEWLHITGKGGQEAALPVHVALAEALGEWRAVCRSPRWVHPSPQGGDRPASEATMRRLWREIASVAGMEGVTPHQARHRFGTAMLAQVHDLALVQDLMRHRSPATTRIYTRVESGSLARAIRQLDYDARA